MAEHAELRVNVDASQAADALEILAVMCESVAAAIRIAATALDELPREGN